MLRHILDLNQAQMAEELDVSQSYYSNIEGGKKPISPKLLGVITERWPAQWGSIADGDSNKLLLNADSNTPNSVTVGGQDEFIRETYSLLESVYNENMQDNEVMTALLKKASTLKNKSLYYSLLATMDIRKERPELLAANQLANDFIVNESIMHQVATNYVIPKLNQNIEYTSYDSFKKEKVKQLEQLTQYATILKPINKATQKFIDAFKPFDTEKSIDFYGHSSAHDDE